MNKVRHNLYDPNARPPRESDIFVIGDENADEELHVMLVDLRSDDQWVLIALDTGRPFAPPTSKDGCIRVLNKFDARSMPMRSTITIEVTR